jgi:anhydro-N-acetylmuramic acid kinase
MKAATKKNAARYSLGLMSGTSADGLTVCLFDSATKKVKYFKTYPYTKKLQNKILGAVNFKTPRLSALNFELGRLYATKTKAFLKEFNINKKDIITAGSHGQTVYHAPCAKIPNTLQIGTAAFLARELKFPVVYDFRARDIAAGGGAPLMPVFDNFLFKNAAPKMLLNIGGIANVAVAGRGIRAFGFDIGPGNALIDTAVNILSAGRRAYDDGGKSAARHAPDIKKARVLAKLFTGATPPQSLDRNNFTKPFLDKYFKVLASRDLATITYLTAFIIVKSLKKFILNKYRVKILEISGGGSYNKTLLKFIQANLPCVEVRPADLIDPLAKEAAAFAWFAEQALKNIHLDTRRSTGAKEKTILGSIILP